ncbi:mitochondrial fission protein ELM1 [Citrus sinensis]|uniref:Mitochondrial fission protein ELM1 n=1 Tax=Citrus sinensis TaxID=2711 RepID=A0ACB8JZT7_CITSI|nr:mitochondrial fission protein ELM1 [Citrus sinensis]
MLRAWGQPMRPTRLPEPAIKLSETPEIFESGFYGVIKRAIIIGNGFAGAENQCIGLVRALGLSGRHSIYIQHPRTHLNRFDMVITPCHDYYPLTPHAQEQIPWFLRRWITPREPPDQHVVLTVGALHQADSAALRSAASVWHDELAVLPKPLFVVNVGGPTSNCTYGVDLAKQLTAMLQGVIWSCGSIRVSFSRRTPEKVAKIIVNEFSNNPKVFIWNGEDPNPHMGHLAWADAFLITADSVSMLSEACSTGKPVYVIGAERCVWKFAYFQKSLQERGVVRPFTGKEDISENWSYPPLNDLAEAANRVKKALAERGWRLCS